MTRTRSNAGKLSASSRKIVNRDRRRIAKEIAHERQVREDRIRHEFETFESRKEREGERRARNGVVNGASSVLRTVGSSWDVNLPIQIRDRGFTDWGGLTDFTSIEIHVPMTAFVQKEDGSFNQDDLREGMLNLLALGYHEIGHNMFTIPFNHLPFNAMGVDHNNPDTQLMQLIWNCLEDQRMETAVVSESPIIAQYFAAAMPKIIKEVNNLHLMIHGRSYLPDSYRASARALFVELNGEEWAVKAENIIDRYVKATTVNQLCSAVIDMVAVYKHLQENGQSTPDGGGVDEHGDPYLWGNPETCMGDESQEDRAKRTGKAVRKAQREQEKSEVDGSEAGASEGEDSDEGDGETGNGSVPGTGSSSDTGEPGEGSEGEGDSSDPTPKEKQGPSGWDESEADFEAAEASQTTENDLRDMADEIVQQAKDHLRDHLDMHAQEFTHSANETDSGDFPVAALAGTLSTEKQAEAEVLAQRMVKAFEQAVANRDPSWQRNVDHGVINSFRYKTRQRGDRNFYSRRSGDNAIGSDIAVTLMLDNSGSMEGSVVALSVMSYAVKLACEEIGAACRVLLFNSGTYILSDVHDEPVPVRIVATGGTNPDEGLLSLAEPLDDATHHLALVMTDGAFNHVDGDFNYGDTHVLGYLFDPDGGEGYGYDDRDSFAQSRFTSKGIFNARYITTLEAMAEDVESYIVNKLR